MLNDIDRAVEAATGRAFEERYGDQRIEPDPDAAYDAFIQRQIDEQCACERIAYPLNDLITALGRLAASAEVQAAGFQCGSWEWVALTNLAARYRQAQVVELAQTM